MRPDPREGTGWEVTDPAGRVLAIRERPAALSVTVDRDTVYTFERTGRFYGAFVGGANYRRGMDHRILVKRRLANAPVAHDVQVLPYDEAWSFIAVTHGRMAAAQEAFRRAAGSTPAEGDRLAPALAWFARIVSWSPSRLEADGEAFRKIYSPIGILPPDQYMALVLQSSVGCPWNRCTFCGFYRGVPYHLRTPAELADHIREVRRFMGEGMLLRRAIFLGDADALAAPSEHLAQILDLLAREFPSGDDGHGPSSRDVHAFADVVSMRRYRRADFRILAGRGLRRVYVGLETGHDPLRKLVKKRGTTRQSIEAVRSARAGGLSVGVIVIVGLGGHATADAHVRDTADAVAAMGLGPDDRVFLSPLVTGPDLEYLAKQTAEGVHELGPEGVAAQAEALRRALTREDGPRVALYDIERFIY